MPIHIHYVAEYCFVYCNLKLQIQFHIQDVCSAKSSWGMRFRNQQYYLCSLLLSVSQREEHRLVRYLQREQIHNNQENISS